MESWMCPECGEESDPLTYHCENQECLFKPFETGKIPIISAEELNTLRHKLESQILTVTTIWERDYIGEDAIESAIYTLQMYMRGMKKYYHLELDFGYDNPEVIYILQDGKVLTEFSVEIKGGDEKWTDEK